MKDISLIAVLKRHGWKTHTKNTLLCWKKERLVEEVQALEINYACSLEMSDNQYNLLQKLTKENEQLKEQVETYQTLAHRRGECYLISLREMNKLKQQIEEMKNCLNCTHGGLTSDGLYCYAPHEIGHDRQMNEKEDCCNKWNRR